MNKYKGCLVGLAVGDAIGTTVEFMDRGTFPLVTTMTGGGPFNLNPGQWTDDTSMALCLSNSLIEKGFDAHDQIQKYINWRDYGYMSVTGHCFDIGSNISNALSKYEMDSTSPYCGSIDKYASGNGGIMRIAPIPMYFKNYDSAIKYAVLSSEVTHGSNVCNECAVIITRLLHAILNSNITKAECKRLVLSNVIPRFRTIDFINKSINDINGSGYVVESLEAALWCFFNTDGFEDAVLTAVNLGNDADTTAAIVGQIAGAFYGYDTIPKDWLNKLYWHDIIVDTAAKLYLNI